MSTLANLGVPQPGFPQRGSTQNSVTENNVLNNVLNCYEILNARRFSPAVNIYRIEFVDPSKQMHDNRGEAKNIIWNLRRNDFRSLWRGYGFVLDLNP
jgi:hypothetical protein